jgi:uncharacterized protein (TIGR01244 family)
MNKTEMCGMKLTVGLILVSGFGLWAQHAGKAPSQDIYKFLRLSENYCTGGQPKTSELAGLKQEGIRSIINLRRPSEHAEAEEAAEARRLGFRYYNIPVNSRAPKDEQVEEFLQILEDSANLPVFIHCAPASRVGGFWMIRRTLVDGWSLEKAEEEARRIGLRSASVMNFARHYIERHGK